MYGILNVLSLLLGMMSWISGAAALICRSRKHCMTSFCACTVSVYLQLCCIRHLAAIRDWAAIEDTVGAVTFAAAVLLAGTVLLNLAAWILTKN